jgi:hypothetical protein
MADGSFFLNDLRGCSFEAWVAFAFDRPVPAGKEANWWHLHEDDAEMFLIVDPVLQVEHARRLFSDPLFLRDRFTAAQLEQGFWFLSSSGPTVCGKFFADHLWDSRFPLELRRAAIGAMFDLYAKLFALFPTEDATYMWWDLLVSNVIEDDDGESIVPRSDADQEQVRLAMVATLGRILQLEQRHCQEAAMHALKHIATPRERSALIDPFLRLPRDEKLLAYARECRAGRAQ